MIELPTRPCIEKESGGNRECEKFKFRICLQVSSNHYEAKCAYRTQLFSIGCTSPFQNHRQMKAERRAILLGHPAIS